MKLIKTMSFLFLLMFTTHGMAKGNEYYKATLVHVLTECNSDCQRLVFREQIDVAFYELMNAILVQLKYELSQKEKRNYD